LIELGRHLRVDAQPGGGDLLLLFANGRFPCGDIGLLAGDLILVMPAGSRLSDRRPVRRAMNKAR
jgi:hypothetical protein